MISYLGREFVHGGHLLALGTASIAAFSALLLGFAPTWDLILMAYLFSYGAYTVNRSVEIDKDALTNPERTKHLQSRKRYLPLVAGACFAVGYILAAFRNIFFFSALLLPLALTVAYSVGSKRLVPVMGASKLKEKLLAKNIAISFGWSLIPLLVGLYYLQLEFAILLLAPFVFLRLMVNTIFFDARDRDGDKKNGLRTIPTVYGEKGSYKVMHLIDFLSALYLIVVILAGFLPIYSAVMLVFPIYSTLYELLALRYRSKIDILADVVGDGEYILWGPILVLGRIII
jgi:4-hydroxybenzoate polyprenyltransferase